MLIMSNVGTADKGEITKISKNRLTILCGRKNSTAVQNFPCRHLTKGKD
jgi:hypothetical protein